MHNYILAYVIHDPHDLMCDIIQTSLQAGNRAIDIAEGEGYRSIVKKLQDAGAEVCT